MIAQNGDVGAVDRTAHVQAAGQGNPQFGRHAVLLKIIEHLVHHGLDRPGSVGGRGMAVYPPLGVDDVGDRRAGPAHRELVAAARKLTAFEIFDQRIDLGFVVHHEFDVVSGGEAKVSVAVLVGYLADFPDVDGGHQTGTAGTNGEHLVPGLGNVHQHAGFENFVVEPFTLVGGDHRRVKLVVFARADVADPVFHRLIWIVS